MGDNLRPVMLLEHYRAGNSPVLIVDEAQGLPLSVLEEIRLLLNPETPQEKLLQIVLSGQPELEEKLNRPELCQLGQRITLRCNTTPLTLEETHGYIQQRLHIAGANGEPVFVSEAMNAGYFYSHGIRSVPARMVEQVTREFQFDEVKPFAQSARDSCLGAGIARTH